MKDIISKINMILEIEKTEVEFVDENLQIYNNSLKKIDTKKVSFTKKNIQKIAYELKAEIITMDKDLKSAKLKDSKGKLIFIDGA